MYKFVINDKHSKHQSTFVVNAIRGFSNACLNVCMWKIQNRFQKCFKVLFENLMFWPC